MYVDTSLYDLKWTHENTNTNTSTTHQQQQQIAQAKNVIRFRLEFLVFNRRDLSYVYIARKICYMHKRDIVFWVTTIEERRSGVAFMYQPSYFMCTRARRVTGVVFGHAILSLSSARKHWTAFHKLATRIRYEYIVLIFKGWCYETFKWHYVYLVVWWLGICVSDSVKIFRSLGGWVVEFYAIFFEQGGIFVLFV